MTSSASSEIVIHGRPDMQAWRSGIRFGVTQAKRFPPYVYGTRGNACLIHKVLRVELHWWRCRDTNSLVRCNPPWMFAYTVCGQRFRIDDSKWGATCAIPKPDAVLCGRCHGEGPVFGKHSKQLITKREAKQKLGCIANGNSRGAE
jgi:hypothetical protein